MAERPEVLTAKLHAERIARRGKDKVANSTPADPDGEKRQPIAGTDAPLPVQSTRALGTIEPTDILDTESNLAAHAVPADLDSQRPPSPVHARPRVPSSNVPVDAMWTFAMSAREDFDCPLCTKLLVHPISLLCGHTFCRSCIRRALTLTPACPLCRAPCFTNVRDAAANFVLQKTIERFYSDELSTRIPEVEQDDSDLDSQRLSLFLLPGSGIDFPGTPVSLVVYEPRYLLLVQRCLDHGTLFGIIDNSMSTTGVAVRIDGVQRPPGGSRLVISGSTTTRFRCMRAPEAELDSEGLLVAPVTFYRDDVLSTLPSRPMFAMLTPASAATLRAAPHDAARAVLLRNAISAAIVRLVSSLSPDAFRAFTARHGLPPQATGETPATSPERWSYFAADALALAPDVRQRAIATTDTLERLLIVYTALEAAEAASRPHDRGVTPPGESAQSELDPCVHAMAVATLALYSQRSASAIAAGLSSYVMNPVVSSVAILLFLVVALWWAVQQPAHWQQTYSYF